MKSQVKKIGYAGMLVLLVLWWMGQAEGGGGDTKSLVGWLKSMYSGLLSRVSGVEQKMGGLEKQIANVKIVSETANTRAESAKANANSAKARAESAEANANEAKKRAESAEANANEAKARGNEAEAKAKDAKDKAHSAEQRAKAAEEKAKQANERANQAEQRANRAKQRVGELQGSIQRLQEQLAQQMHAFQAYRKLFAKEEAARIAEQAARIAEEAEARTRRAGEQKYFEIGGVGFKMRWIPAGSFMMGSPDSDSEASGNEKPQRSVTLTKGYWMMETEVTQGQYKAVMGYNPSKHTSCGDDCPVESVSWHEAALFANKLSEIAQLSRCFDCKGEGSKAFCGAHGNKGSDYIGCKGWRLPTEAEWEYAARAGTSTPRYGELDAVGWYYYNTGSQPKPVRQKSANAWGLYDTLGNVWEWVYDRYDSSAYTKLGAVDPVSVADTSYRVGRGGCWFNYAKPLRAANRDWSAQSDRDGNLGFRLARR